MSCLFVAQRRPCADAEGTAAKIRWHDGRRAIGLSKDELTFIRW